MRLRAYLALQRKEEAFVELDGLEKMNDSWTSRLQDPIYDSIRREPRFQAMRKPLAVPGIDLEINLLADRLPALHLDGELREFFLEQRILRIFVDQFAQNLFRHSRSFLSQIRHHQ